MSMPNDIYGIYLCMCKRKRSATKCKQLKHLRLIFFRNFFYRDEINETRINHFKLNNLMACSTFTMSWNLY